MSSPWRLNRLGALLVCFGCLACRHSDPCPTTGVLSFVTFRDGGSCDNESAPNGLTRVFRVESGDASYAFIPLDGTGDPRPNVTCQGNITSCQLDLSCSGTIAGAMAAPDRRLTESYDVELRPDGGSSGTESVDVTRAGVSCHAEYVVTGVRE